MQYPVQQWRNRKDKKNRGIIQGYKIVPLCLITSLMKVQGSKIKLLRAELVTPTVAKRSDFYSKKHAFA